MLSTSGVLHPYKCYENWNKHESWSTTEWIMMSLSKEQFLSHIQKVTMFGLELGFCFYGNITVSPQTKEYHSWGRRMGFFFLVLAKGQYLKLWACLVKRNFWKYRKQ